jgi:peptide subunit release factor 1 (eRF1)
MPALQTEWDALLDRLTLVEPQSTPVLSLYLNTQADEHGRDRIHRFIRDELHGRVRGFHGHDGLRRTLSKDVERINDYLTKSLRPETNGAALFACAAAGLFEAMQFDAPFPRHQLHLGPLPHLYPLALLNDQFPRYAALVADSNTARILVFALNRRVAEKTVTHEKTSRTSGSGWSQARFQRHVDEKRQQHVKDVVDHLAEIVRADEIHRIVVAGEDVIVARLRERLPAALASMVVDTLRLDITTPEHEILRRTMDAIREKDARGDQAIVQQALAGHYAGGLGAAGLEDVLAALERGQVHVLLLTAAARTDGIIEEPAAPKKQQAATKELPRHRPRQIDEDQATALINLARQTDAEVRFIQDPELLWNVSGVAALLRYR